MRTLVKGKNLDVPDADRLYAERKLQRLERVLDDRTDAVVELSIEHHRSEDDTHIAEVTLVVKGQPLRGVAHAPTHRTAIDRVVDKLERQAVHHKEQPRRRSRSIEERQLLRAIADGTSDDDRRPQVVKVKRFAIEPMFEEDAVTQMEDLGHSFFVFVNAENERVAILYRRNDGDYGLIEPSIGGVYTLGDRARQRD